MADDIRIPLPDEAATLALGARLGQALSPGLYIALSGDLGAGKTTLVRGLLRGLGFAGRVKSPTYNLVELYTLPGFDLYHFDLYRFNDPQEWDAAGFREFFNAATVCLVEWPERAAGLLPPADMHLFLGFVEEGDAREARITAASAAGQACLNACLNACLSATWHA